MKDMNRGLFPLFVGMVAVKILGFFTTIGKIQASASWPWPPHQ